MVCHYAGDETGETLMEDRNGSEDCLYESQPGVGHTHFVCLAIGGHLD